MPWWPRAAGTTATTQLSGHHNAIPPPAHLDARRCGSDWLAAQLVPGPRRLRFPEHELPIGALRVDRVFDGFAVFATENDTVSAPTGRFSIDMEFQPVGRCGSKTMDLFGPSGSMPKMEWISSSAVAQNPSIILIGWTHNPAISPGTCQPRSGKPPSC